MPPLSRLPKLVRAHVRAIRIDLSVLDGAPGAVIVGEHGVQAIVDGSLRIALLWYLRDGKPRTRKVVAEALYGEYDGEKLKHLLRRIDVLGDRHFDGVLVRDRRQVRLGIPVCTDRMRMSADITAGNPAGALERYDASPVDVQQSVSGRDLTGARELQVGRLFEEMAADGLAGFLEAAAARLAQLEDQPDLAGINGLERLLRPRCEEAYEAEPIFERIHVLRNRVARLPRTSVTHRLSDADTPVSVVGQETALLAVGPAGHVGAPTIPPADSATGHSRVRPISRSAAPWARRSRWHLPSAIAVGVLASTLGWAMRVRAFESVAQVAPLARIGVLYATGGVGTFALWTDTTATLGAEREVGSMYGTNAWRQGIRVASSLNALELDPSSDDLVTLSTGPSGLDIMRLRDDGTSAPLVQGPEDDYGAVFSADGRWMAYASARGSTSAKYDVDLWLRDRFTGSERRIAARPGSYEQPLRFDRSSSLLWVSANNTTSRTSEVCRLRLANMEWECRSAPVSISLAFRARSDTLVGIMTGTPGDVAQLAELVWERNGVSMRPLHRLPAVAGCTAHPALDLVACVATNETVVLVDGGPDRLRMHTLGRATSGARRVFFLPVPGEGSRRLAAADVTIFGAMPPVATNPPGDFTLTLSATSRWRSGIVLNQEFDARRRTVVFGSVTLPLTDSHWQTAVAWIGQLPTQERRPVAAVLADSSGADGVDGFTRNGVWDSAVCTLSIPGAEEPQQSGVVELRGRFSTRTLVVPSAGSTKPVSFALEFDGRDTCIADVGGVVGKIPTRALADRSLLVALTGRAVGTTGVVRGVVVRGTPVRGSAARAIASSSS